MVVNKWIGVSVACLSTLSLFAQAETRKVAMSETNRARLIVMADMGNEPDEVQQMLHLLMCAE